ncbi:MAG: hypothetical protein HC850_13545 [Rhodomicrobium sp.]|nr:hypothetical protein [Rhodomicrobium sp.]
MIILRLAPLPPELEVELYRQTSGETVKWAGVSNGLVERIQGWAIIAGGVILAMFNVESFLNALAAAGELLGAGARISFGDVIEIAAGVAFFLTGVGVAIFGWRFILAADKVIWAVTNRRLVRVIADGKSEPRSWMKRDIVKVDRMNWEDAEKRGLAITVHGKGENDPVLFIFGPPDLEAAEKALAELEG